MTTSGQILHIKSQFEFCLKIGVVDLEETMHEFSQINVVTGVQVKHCEQTFTNDAR